LPNITIIRGICNAFCVRENTHFIFGFFHSRSRMHDILFKFVGMRNLIIVTSAVFIAIVVVSYVYFSNLSEIEQYGQEDIDIIDRAADSVDKMVTDGITENLSPLWTFKLNAEPTSKPGVFLLDDTQRFVLVQDAYHILYAVSANGEKLWNAQLPGAIVGSIQQLADSSLLFTTTERLYRIDRAGDPLTGFSLPLPQKATGSGATASYQDKDEIRIDVQAGSRIFSFDGRGRRIPSRNAHPALDIQVPPGTDSPVDCGPFAYYGPLLTEETNYLLCGNEGKLSCFRYD